MPAWTQTQDAALKALLADGLSMSWIAAKLDISRNAVVGRIHRLGLQSSKGSKRLKPSAYSIMRPSPSAHQSAITGKSARILRALHAEMKTAAPLAPSTTGRPAGGIGLLDLGPTDCRWPINNPERGAEFLFCGASKATGTSYCALHSKMAFVAPRPSKLRDAFESPSSKKRRGKRRRQEQEAA